MYPAVRQALILGCLALGAAAAQAGEEALVQTQGGATWIEPRRALLEDLGLELRALAAPEGDAKELRGPASWNGRPGQMRFDVEGRPGLRLVLEGGALRRFAGGELRHRGELALVGAGVSVDLSDFVLAPGPRVETLVLRRPGEAEALFELDHGHVGYARKLGQLVSLNMDLRASAGLAARLGRPELAGKTFGLAHVRLRAPGGRAASAPRGTGTVDLHLYNVDLVEQYTRQPGEKVAFGPATAVKNVGTGDVPWYWSIAPAPDWAPELGQHPYLVFNVYREAGDAFEQIGASDVKHAFYATNVICEDPPDTGQILVPDCSDSYGTGNNSDQFHYGPRSEVRASTGDWQALGSHFDGEPVDGIRDHDSETDPFAHLLTARESDLTTPGARYYLEGWYLAQGDVDPVNNMGWRMICPRLRRNVWLFNCDPEPPYHNGPAMDAWGESRSGVATSDGRLRLAVQTEALAGGFWRYRHALMNLDFDRGVRSFALALEPGTAVRNLGFRDADGNAANDWTAVESEAELRWSTEANPLGWGTLYSFSFEADRPPVTSVARLEVPAETGPPLEAQTLGVRFQRLSTPTPSPVPRLHVLLGLLAVLWPARQWRCRKRRKGSLGCPGSSITEA